MGQGGGGGVESNLSSRRGWTGSYFNFNSGGLQLYFKAYFANFRTHLPPDNYCTVPNVRSFHKKVRSFYNKVRLFHFLIVNRSLQECYSSISSVAHIIDQKDQLFIGSIEYPCIYFTANMTEYCSYGRSWR